MRGKRNSWFWLIALSLGVAPATVVAAEWITVNPLELELLLSFDSWKRSYENTETRQHDWIGGLSLEQDGYVLDPGILRFSYYLEPKYVSGTYEYPGFSEDNSDNFLSYYVTVDWLQASVLPVLGSFVASNTTETLSGSLGRRTESETGYYLASISWESDWLPTDFRYERRELFSISTSAPGSAPRLRDQDDDVFRLQARNSKLAIDLESRRVDDKVPERDNDFDLDRATLTHRLGWGKGSNLRSRYHYFDRRGFNPIKQLDLSETAHVWHLDSLYSLVEYRFQSTEQTQKIDSHYAAYLLTHQLYRNLTTTPRISFRQVKSDDLLETEQLAGLDLAYSKSDMKKADVSAAFGVSYSLNDRDSKLGLQEVVDEPQTVRLTGEVVLNSRFILSGTIVVTDATSTRVYVEGIDYVVESLVNSLTRLLVLPGGEIQSGDLILVSYQAIRLPSVEYNRLNTSGSFNFRLGRFSFSYFGNQTNYDVISGLGGDFLTDTRDTTLRADYFWSTLRTTTGISAERRDYRNGPFETTSYTYGQALSVTLSSNSQMNVNLTQSFSKSPQEEIDAYIVDVLMTWQPRPNWSVRPTVGAWRRTQNRLAGGLGEIEDQILSAGLSILWSYRLLSADLTYYHNGRTTDGSNSVSDSLYVNLRRRFR